MGPLFAIFRPIASLFSGIMVGSVTHMSDKNGQSRNKAEGRNHNTNGQKSFSEIFSYGFKVIPGEIANWLILGVIIGGAITAR